MAEVEKEHESLEMQDTPPTKKVSEKQYLHLQKAREAKKRKHEELLKSDLDTIKNHITTIQKEIEELKKPEVIEPSTKKVKVYDIFYDPITISCVLALSMATLGGIYFRGTRANESDMYRDL